MTRAAGRALARANLELLVVNRSAMPRNRLAREIGARPVAWERFFAGDHPVDALVTAVGTVEHVADGPTLSRLGPAVPGRHLLVVDLGVPANIGEQAAAAAGARFVGMDSLIADAAAERPDALLGTARIRAILEQHLTRVLRRSATRAAGPLIGALRDQFESRVDQEIECLLRSDLPHLDDAQREALRVWGGRLAHRMAHVPLQGLRSLAAAGELDRVEECVHAMQRALEGRAEERT
jgi:glutamyl-tRNA reductase